MIIYIYIIMYCQLNHYLKILTVGEILGSLSRWLTPPGPSQCSGTSSEGMEGAWRERNLERLYPSSQLEVVILTIICIYTYIYIYIENI